MTALPPVQDGSSQDRAPVAIPPGDCGDGVEAQVARVLPDGRVEVIVQRASACAGCHARHVCVPGEQDVRAMILEADVRVSVGDRVLVGTRRPSAALAAGLAYGIPLVGMAGLGAAAWAWLSGLTSPARDLWAAGAAVLGAGIGLGGVALLDRALGRRLSWRRRFEVRVVRRLSPSGSPQD
ncbi:MAG TPA: SoxR reducing system RseC family protein [Myxococcota bacterium]|nr:SoxR reducing system RseC family protein [Myxococcota bacterium]HQK51882.1 SoxR reducing system RseC family protein [Myxococcota bacterium]